MNPLLCGIAENPALPSELLDRLIEIADDDIALSLAFREDLNAAQAVALASRHEVTVVRLAETGLLSADAIDPLTHPLAALALLDAGAGRPEWGRILAKDPSVERREKLAACPGLPEDVAETLAADPDVRVVEELALWATPDTAARLAGHPHADVRSAVAANEATPPAVLAALVSGEGLPPARRCRVCDREKIPFVHDPHCSRIGCDLLPGAACDGSHESTVHEMRLRALRNPALPAETAVGFVSHPSMPLRRQLAAREDLPPWAYRRLADDPIPGVRSELAANPAVDVALLRTLAADQDRDVRRALAHHPDVPLDVLAELARGTRLGSPLLPRIVAASPTEVRELAESPEPLLRMLVARRRDLPPEVRDALAADADAKVAKSIAPHPGLSEAGLRSMVDRHGVQVIAKVATNPDATPELLEDLARHRPPVRKSFREIARHPNATGAALLACLSDRQARPIAAGHPALPTSVLIELLTDDDWRTAEAAAANASLPLAVMAALVSRGPNEDPCA